MCNPIVHFQHTRALVNFFIDLDVLIVHFQHTRALVNFFIDLDVLTYINHCLINLLRISMHGVLDYLGQS